MSCCIPMKAVSPSKARKKTVSINLRVVSAICVSILSRLSRLHRETLHYTENIQQHMTTNNNNSVCKQRSGTTSVQFLCLVFCYQTSFSFVSCVLSVCNDFSAKRDQTSGNRTSIRGENNFRLMPLITRYTFFNAQSV